MSFINNVWTLIKKDLLVEWRQRYAFNGLLLYLVSVIFLIYVSFIELDPFVWITLFWMVMLFAAVNAVAKSFLQEGRGRWLYYYTVASPYAIIVAKMIYNMALMLVLCITGILIYSVVLGAPLHHPLFFFFIAICGCSSFSITFTIMSAIASKAGNGSMIMPILSFPVIIPVLLLIVKMSRESLEIAEVIFPLKDFVLLGSLNAIMLLLGLILFPYLWRD